MKSAVIYDTKTGASQLCADSLAAKLAADVFFIADGEPDLGQYELIVLGGGIYAGRLTGRLRKLIKSSAAALKTKKLGFFVCCADEQGYRRLLSANIPKELLKTASAAECLGCGVDVERAKGFFTKGVAKIMKRVFEKQGKPLMNIHEERIAEFAERLRN